MENKNREKILLAGVCVAVALMVLNWLVITPLTEAWKSRTARIATLRKNIADGATLIKRGGYIRDDWDKMNTNTLASVPTVAERQLFGAFDHWVRDSHVTEGSFKPQLKQTDDNYSVMECRADVTGNLQTIMDFLTALQNDPLGVKVESMEITARDDKGEQLSLGVELNGLLQPPPPQ